MEKKTSFLNSLLDRQEIDLIQFFKEGYTLFFALCNKNNFFGAFFNSYNAAMLPSQEETSFS